MDRASAPVFASTPLHPRLPELLRGYPPTLFTQQLHDSIALMERYSADHAIALLDRLDVRGHLASWRSIPELCQSLSFEPRFSVALKWLLERLIEYGCVDVEANARSRRYRVTEKVWRPDLAGLRAAGLAIDDANSATLDLMDLAASAYPKVARGEMRGEQAFFGLEGIGLWLAYFCNDNPAYAINNWIAAVAAADRVGDRNHVCIVEVGAGAASGSALLLDVLQTRGSPIERYVITEPNAMFRRRAERELRKRYPDLPLEFQALDINAPWQEQGVAANQFDLVYGVNVLHVADDLLLGLNEARALLKRGGWLVIGECLRPYPRQPIYPELMFQILDSFVAVRTDPQFRPNPGFLTGEEWRGLFARANFARIAITPEIERVREICPHFFTGAICGMVDQR